MKKLLIFASLFIISFTTFSQYREEREPREQRESQEEGEHKFRRDNIFLGTSLGLGFGSGSFNVGGNPEIGYTIAQWLDAGVSFNVNYTSYSASYYGYGQRYFNYGGGLFTRIYPYRGFFLQVQPEYNKIKVTYDPGNGGVKEKYNAEAPSLLLGAGFSTREVGAGNFYTAILFDAGTNTNSPYLTLYGKKLPIIRAGFNIYLHPKR